MKLSRSLLTTLLKLSSIASTVPLHNFDGRQVELQDKVLVVRRRRMLANVERAEQSVEVVGGMNIVVRAEHGEESRHSEAARPEERISKFFWGLFELLDINCLVCKYHSSFLPSPRNILSCSCTLSCTLSWTAPALPAPVPPVLAPPAPQNPPPPLRPPSILHSPASPCLALLVSCLSAFLSSSCPLSCI